MFPGDPRVIKSDDDLVEVGQQMKVSAYSDDPEDGYTKTSEEADNLFKSIKGTSKKPVLSEEDIKQLRIYTGSRALIIGNSLVSAIMTTDDHHDHQWHISLCSISGPNPSDLCEVAPEIRDRILNSFFAEYKSIPNPGKMTQVLHYVGND